MGQLQLTRAWRTSAEVAGRGGFGMFGGTVVVAGVGGLAGAGVGAAGARLTPLSWGEIVIETIKADLITRLVIINAENDDQRPNWSSKPCSSGWQSREET